MARFDASALKVAFRAVAREAAGLRAAHIDVR